MPTPTPPNTTSPSAMLSIAMPPASGVRLSCEELTAPVEVSVVTVAHSTEAPMPLRTSLPSWLPPACVEVAAWVGPDPGQVGVAGLLAPEHDAHAHHHEHHGAAKSAQPCRWLPANLPNM